MLINNSPGHLSKDIHNVIRSQSHRLASTLQLPKQATDKPWGEQEESGGRVAHWCSNHDSVVAMGIEARQRLRRHVALSPQRVARLYRLRAQMRLMYRRVAGIR
uniref:Uncharacterized protein n=1 Tax=Oryza brachyantha TaxID=4533 RepID=J3LZP6_ORYBR